MLRRSFIAAFSVLILSTGGPPGVAGPALLFDPDNGKVLYSEAADQLWHPASLTKVMTAYITFEAIKAGRLRLDDKVVCSEPASKQPPSKLGLPVGTELSVELALKAIIIKSANDVTIMLAEKIAGSESAFVDLMNQTAKRLGMTRTHFVNTNGLPEKQQVTTARDLAKLARAVTKEYAEYAHIWAMSDMRLGKMRLSSHNSLLKSFPGADGMKTGFICDSGFNVIASATRDGRRLMAVVLGESSSSEREVRAGSLLEHGFQTYGWKHLFSTQSIDAKPARLLSDDAASVRDEVVAWSCASPEKRARLKREYREKLKAKARSKAERRAALRAELDAVEWPVPKVRFKQSVTPASDAAPGASTGQAIITK